MKRTSSMLFVISTLFLLALTPCLATDGYLPTLLYVGKYFKLNDQQMQLTLNIFAFTNGLGQLVFGPFSDRYGRRPVACAASLLFALSSFFYMYAENYGAFLCLRFMQGLGAAGMGVLAYTIIRDLYSGQKMSKAYGYIAGVAAFSPIFAPLLGGWLAAHFGWQAAGYMFFTPAILTIFVLFGFLREPLPKTKRVPLNWSTIIAYKKIFLNKVFLFYTLMSAIGLAVAFIFCAISTYILMGLLKYSAQSYGVFYACYGIIYMIGNFTAGHVVEKIGIEKGVLCGLLMGTAGALWLLTWNYFTGLSFTSFYVPIMLSIVGCSFCQVAGISGAVKKFRKNVGAAVALNSAMRYIFIALAGALVVNKNIQSAFPAGISILILNLLGIGAIAINFKLKNKEEKS